MNRYSAVVGVRTGFGLLRHRFGAGNESDNRRNDFFRDQTKVDERLGDTMTTNEPPWYQITEDEKKPFPKRKAAIEESSGIEEKFGGFLLEELTDTDHLAGIMSRHGHHKVSEFIRGHKVPNRLNIKVGNFGEVLFGRMLEKEEGFIRPIENSG